MFYMNLFINNQLAYLCGFNYLNKRYGNHFKY